MNNINQIIEPFTVPNICEQLKQWKNNKFVYVSSAYPKKYYVVPMTKYQNNMAVTGYALILESSPYYAFIRATILYGADGWEINPDYEAYKTCTINEED